MQFIWITFDVLPRYDAIFTDYEDRATRFFFYLSFRVHFHPFSLFHNFRLPDEYSQPHFTSIGRDIVYFPSHSINDDSNWPGPSNIKIVSFFVHPKFPGETSGLLERPVNKMHRETFRERHHARTPANKRIHSVLAFRIDSLVYSISCGLPGVFVSRNTVQAELSMQTWIYNTRTGNA